MHNEYTIGTSLDGTFYITSPLDIFGKVKGTSCSTTILQARLFGMEPAQFFRMLSEKYDVELLNYRSFIGCHFKKKAEAVALGKELSKRYQHLCKEMDGM
jgi:hypothetical protein